MEIKQVDVEQLKYEVRYLQRHRPSELMKRKLRHLLKHKEIRNIINKQKQLEDKALKIWKQIIKQHKQSNKKN